MYYPDQEDKLRGAHCKLEELKREKEGKWDSCEFTKADFHLYPDQKTELEEVQRQLEEAEEREHSKSYSRGYLLG